LWNNNLVSKGFDNSPNRQTIPGGCSQTRLPQYSPHEYLRFVQNKLGWMTFLFENIWWTLWTLILDALINSYVYPEVYESRWNWDSDTKTTANGNNLDYLKGLSAKLQRRDIDPLRHTQWLTISNQRFNVWRMTLEMVRRSKGADWASYISTEEEMPRVPRIQCNRLNVPAGTPLLY